MNSTEQTNKSFFSVLSALGDSIEVSFPTTTLSCRPFHHHHHHHHHLGPFIAYTVACILVLFFFNFQYHILLCIISRVLWIDKQWSKICNLMWHVLGIFREKKTTETKHHFWVMYFCVVDGALHSHLLVLLDSNRFSH